MYPLRGAFDLLLYLCATVLCRGSHLTATFKATVIRTTWIASGAQFVGQLSKFDCTQKCAAADNNCFAFHMTPDSKCYLVRENRNWMEQRPMQDVTFWIKQGAPDTACKAPEFPESFGKSRYFYEKVNKKSFTDAVAFCESKGAKLAQISTAAEMQFLWNVINIPEPNSEHVHIGGYKSPNDGLPHEQGWKWRGSEESFDSSLWKSTEPNNVRNEEYCVEIKRNTTVVNDGNCESDQKFICECSTL